MTDRLTIDPQAATWQRAIRRALANGFDTVTPMWLENDQYGIEALYRVVSASTPGTVHSVHLVDDDGVTLTCDCPVGRNGLVCWHMAAVALVTRNLQEPEPDPPPAPLTLALLKKLGHSDETEDRKRRIAAAVSSFGSMVDGSYLARLQAGELG